jgi:protein involved in polysaccharide export with SLBB domain
MYLAASISHAGNAVDEYRLGVGDRVYVKMGQWNIVEQTYDNWEGLEGEYVVGPDGSVSIALAGAVPASGMTVHEIAEEIAARVQQKIGTPLPPATSVEVAGFRPVYVVGAVTTPGEFAYRPQMTVLQAVALAGGYFRTDTGLAGILAAKLDSLNSEIDIREKQLDSARAELEKQSKLLKRGIVNSSHLAEYERRVNDIEVSLLQLGVAVLTVEQQLNEANPSGLNLINARRERNGTGSRDAGEDRPELIHQLIRTVEGKITTVIVDENYLLHPGDTLKIAVIDESADSAASVSGED